MNRKELELYIKKTYHVEAEFPWGNYPGNTVYRHKDNRKWFALVMAVPKEKLGLSGVEDIDVLNIKCEPLMIDYLKMEPGFFPAYHMNKTNWITMLLDGSIGDEKIKSLLDMSFELTGQKKKGSPRLTGPK